MRTWRKLYASILDSEQISALSDPATFLLTALVAAQDDTGYYPWSPPKIRRLIVARPLWTLPQAKEYADELIAVGLASWEEGGILLTGGERLNGRPRQDRVEDRYSRNGHVTVSDIPVTVTDTPREEKRRVEKEKSRVEKNAPALRANAEITLGDMALLKEQYPSLDVETELKDCKVYWENEVKPAKRGSPNIRKFRNWLKNALKYQEERNGQAQNSPTFKGADGSNLRKGKYGTFFAFRG